MISPMKSPAKTKKRKNKPIDNPNRLKRKRNRNQRNPQEKKREKKTMRIYPALSDVCQNKGNIKAFTKGKKQEIKHFLPTTSAMSEKFFLLINFFLFF